MISRILAAAAIVFTPAMALAQTPPGTGMTMPSMPAQGAMPAIAGSAQQQEQMASMMSQAAHNQLGVLEYCQSKGSVGEDVVALQKRIIGLLPPVSGDAGLDQAEASGKDGKVVFAGNTVALSDAATQKNTTVDAMCKQMGSMLLAQAKNLPN